MNGPPVSASFGADGTPTQAATGFATRNGADVASLERVETPKGVYLAFRKKQRGKAAVDVLPEVLRATLRGLAFPKAMRWDAMLDDGGGELLFGRPIRWILFLYGGRVVPFTISRTPAAQNSQVQDVTSGAVTYGHRFLTTSGRAGRAIKVRSFDDYRSRLLENFVVLEHEERHNKIASALDANAQRLHGRVSRAVRAESLLLEEVPDLIEYPGVVAGTFSHEFLELPEEVLTTTLIHHQHYFPVEGEDGRLKNAFLAVINTEPENPRIDRGECGARRHGAPSGREILLGDRSACDARITAGSFVDVAVPQEARQLPRKGRSHRASGATDCDGAFSRVRGRGESRRTRRAGCRRPISPPTWFVSSPSCKGRWAAFTPARNGCPEEVWKAIYYHYLPVGVEADAPPSRAQLGKAAVTWAAVSLADKIDTVVGLFAAGEKPTGSRDPYGLRRAAHGILRVLVDLRSLTGLTVRPTLQDLLDPAIDVFPMEPEQLIRLHRLFPGASGVSPRRTRV